MKTAATMQAKDQLPCGAAGQGFRVLSAAAVSFAVRVGRSPALGIDGTVSRLALILALGAAPVAQGAVITLGADNANNTSSFNTALSWSSGRAPEAGNAYETNGHLLRSPASLSGSLTFLGDKLTVNSGSVFVLKSASGSTLTINSKVSDPADPGGLVIDGGTVANGNASNTQFLAGVITIGAGGAEFAADSSGRAIGITAQVTGSGTIAVTSATTADGLIAFGNASNNYTGNLTVGSGAILRQYASSGLSSEGTGIVTVNGALQLRTGGATSTASTNAAINRLAGASTGTVTSGNTASTLTIDGASGTSNFAGVVGGGGGGALSLVKTGNSTQVLSGANTYTGTTTISGGTLSAASNTALSSGAVRVNGTGTLGLGAVNFANAVTLDARVDLTPHILSIGASHQDGAITVQGAGNFNLSAGTTGSDSLSVGVITDADNNNHTLNLLGDAGGIGTASGAITLDGSGADTIAKSGSGAWTISGDTTADALSVSAGTLGLTTKTRSVTNVGVSGGRLDVDSALTASTTTVSGGTLDLGAALTTANAVGVSGGTVTQTGSNIKRDNQTGGFNVASPGAVNLNGSNASMSGLTGNGTLDNASATGAALTLGNTLGTAADFSGTIEDTGTGVLSLVKDETNTQTLSGTVNTSGTVTVQAGGLIMSGAGDTVGGLSVSGGRLDVDGSGITTGAGTVAVSGGTLDLGAVLDTTSQVQVTGGTVTQTGSHLNRVDQTGGFNVVTNGTVDLNGQNASITALNGDTTGKVDNTAADPATLTLGNTTAGSGVFSGTIQDTGALSIVKDGNNTQGLGGTVNILGDLTVGGTGGGLAMSGAGSVVDDITVTGARLDVDGTLTADLVTVSGGTLDLSAALTTASTVQVTGGDVTQSGSNINRAVQTGGFNLASGTVDLNGAAASMTALDGAGTVTNGSAVAAALTLGNSATPTPTAAAFSGIIQDDTGVVSLVKDNSNTQALSGASTYTGTTTVSDGALNVRNNNALGATGGTSGTSVSGTGRVELEGGTLTLGEAFSLIGRAGTQVHMQNVAGTNEVTGAVSLADFVGTTTPENYTIESTTGTIKLSAGITSALTGGTRALTLGGNSSDGVNMVGALNMSAGATNQVYKTGDSTWHINAGTIQDADRIETKGGVLALTGNASVVGDTTIFEVGLNSELDVSGLTSTFTATTGQSLRGRGLVDGDAVVASGASVSPGAGGAGAIGALTFEDLLDLKGTLLVDLTGIGAGAADMVDVGTFDITAATLAFNVLQDLNDAVYVFARYANLIGSEFATVNNVPTGYLVDYNYGGNNQIALVSDHPIPVPAPLALIGLGLFGLAARRRLRA